MVIMSALKILIIFIFSFELAKSQLPIAQQYEQNLTSKLLSSTYYSKDIRAQDQVSVSVNIQLKQIISLDEINQMLTITCFIEQFWYENSNQYFFKTKFFIYVLRYDPRLEWDSTQWNNVEVLMLSVKKIWSPDTIVMNSASGDGYMKINADYSYAPVYYDGTVYFATYQIGLQTRY